ncbi:MAG: hypothetical protein MH321_10515 [Leptospiraceae bacterium]|nr:hypothetical protein [Leptospiraceae bacterium]
MPEIALAILKIVDPTIVVNAFPTTVPIEFTVAHKSLASLQLRLVAFHSRL